MAPHLQQRDERRRKDFVWVERVAKLLDSKYSFRGFRFGLDPILNFIPYAGQAVSFSVSLMLVLVMYRNGVTAKVAVKMLLNIIADALLGAIPVFGHVFDFFNKANEKNIKLLREHYFENKHQGSATGIVLATLALLLVVSVLIFYVIWLVAVWWWDLASGLL